MIRLTTSYLLAALLVALTPFAHAETGAEGWLRYSPLTDRSTIHQYDALPSQIVVLGNTPTDKTAATELQRGLTSLLGRPFTVSHSPTDEADTIILTNLSALNKAFTITGDKRKPESNPHALRNIRNH